MADILIRGVEMPQGKEVKVVMLLGKTARCNGKDYQVVELPPHGDLIDASKLIPIYEEMKWSDDYCKECMKGAIWEVEQAPVIVPANKGESE